jgi:uncharacterized protein (TIGR00730 family)
MKAVCVFAGSNAGSRPAYTEAARSLGMALVRRGTQLVYGGGGTGLMGVLADAVLENGGRVTGVIPGPLVERELAHDGVTALEVVGSMHERKARMADLADAFVALPGGLGTLEEFMEIWTWAQLGIHAKPCGLVNAAGYYDRLIGMVDHMVDEGLVRKLHRELIVVDADPERLMSRIEAHVPPELERWLDRRQT